MLQELSGGGTGVQVLEMMLYEGDSGPSQHSRGKLWWIKGGREKKKKNRKIPEKKKKRQNTPVGRTAPTAHALVHTS
jgi:hypothetical protein